MKSIRISKPVPASYFWLSLVVAVMSVLLTSPQTIDLALNFLNVEASDPQNQSLLFILTFVALVISLLCCFLTKLSDDLELKKDIYELVHKESDPQAHEAAVGYLKKAIEQRDGERFCRLDLHKVSSYLRQRRLSKQVESISKFLF